MNKQRKVKQIFCYKHYVLLVFMVVFCLNSFAQKNSSGIKADTIKSGLHKIFSFHTNLIDWVTTMPNLGVEFDFDRRARSHYSIIVSGRYNWNTNHTVNPRLVFNASGIKLEFRKYWRTGNRDLAPVPPVEDIVPDTTLGFIPRETNYLRRRYLSGIYVKNPRSWRAYYLGIYGAYDRYSISLNGSGVQGISASLGLSYGWTLPLTKRIDGSGFDIDMGISAGAIVTQYDKYKYQDESSCYAFDCHQNWRVLPYPMVHDIHVSIVYRFRSIDKKVLYGADRFAYRETQRLERENYRFRKISNKQNAKDSISLIKPLNVVIKKAESQLATYKDTTAYSYYILSNAISRASQDRTTLYGSSMLRNVLIKELEYYMKLAEDRRKEESYETK